MAKICPISNEKVLYLDCLECDEKICKRDYVKKIKKRRKKMKFKRFILIVTILLCIVISSISVFADKKTIQTREEIPSETIIVNDDTYILDEKINNKNIDEKAKLSIGNHTYYKLSTTQENSNSVNVGMLVFLSIATILLYVFLLGWATKIMVV